MFSSLSARIKLKQSSQNHLHVVVASVSVMDDKLALGRQIPWRLKDMVIALRNTEQRLFSNYTLKRIIDNSNQILT